MPEFGGRPSPARLLEAEGIGRKRSSGWQLCPQHPLRCSVLLGAARRFAGLSSSFFFFFFFWFLLYKSQKPSQLPAPSLDGGNVGGAVKIPAASLEHVSMCPRFVSVCSSSLVPVQPL